MEEKTNQINEMIIKAQNELINIFEIREKNRLIQEKVDLFFYSAFIFCFSIFYYTKSGLFITILIGIFIGKLWCDLYFYYKRYVSYKQYKNLKLRNKKNEN